MVLTNYYEGWTSGTDVNVAVEGDPLVLQALQHEAPMNAPPNAVSHIASNGYYGFAAINNEGNNNNNNNYLNSINYNNFNNCNSSDIGDMVGGGASGVGYINSINNTIDIYVNGIPQNVGATGFQGDDDAVGGTAAAGDPLKQQRNKKRCFSGCDVNDENFAGGNGQQSLLRLCGADGAPTAGVAAAKRCRVDQADTDSAAHYVNDFFSMPATQIGTQTCLMDTDDHSMQTDQECVLPTPSMSSLQSLQRQQQMHSQFLVSMLPPRPQYL